MIWRRRYKWLSINVVMAVAVILMGCTKEKPKLKDLDQCWETLGGKTTDLCNETK